MIRVKTVIAVCGKIQRKQRNKKITFTFISIVKFNTQNNDIILQSRQEITFPGNKAFPFQSARNTWSLLSNENFVNAVTPSSSLRPADLISTWRNCSSSKILAEISEKYVQYPVTSEKLNSCFCSDTALNLSKKVLTKTEIYEFQKDLGFDHTTNLINEENLKRNFDDFSRKIRWKWQFRNELSDNLSKVPAFETKSLWKPPASHVCVKLLVSKLEKLLFSNLLDIPESYSPSKDEYQVMRNLAEDRLMITKPADKFS